MSSAARYRKNWTHSLIRRTTQADLRAFAAKLARQYELGRANHIDGSAGISDDAAIRELLRRDKAHFARMKRSRRRKADLTPSGPLSAAGDVINNANAGSP